MKIAFIDNNQYSVYPPENALDAGLYMMGVLAEELIKKNHEITLFASKINQMKPHELIKSSLHPFFEDFQLSYWANANVWEKFNSLMTYDADLYLQMEHALNTRDIDMLHLHTSPFVFALPFIREIKIPKIFTLHTTISEFEEKILANFLSAYSQLDNLYFVSISKNQIKHTNLSKNPNVFTIHHGIKLHNYPFNENGSDNIVFVGRINVNKGPDIAIEVARKLHRKIFLKGRISTDDPSFFTRNIEPYVDNTSVVFDSTITHSTIPHIFGQAKQFLYPIQWEEPFGLVMIESMATGTPVVAYAKGSVPEVIKDGETGFIVNSSDDDIRGNWIIKKTGIEGLCEAVERIYALPDKEYQQMRKNCREHVEKHFTLERMVNDYLDVYQTILNKQK